MITDSQTNFLYLPGTIEGTKTFSENLITILQKHQIPYGFLPRTKDIWAVDYMPIQIDRAKFIRFAYLPDYLNYKKYESIRTDASKVCEAINLTVTPSDIILDGGNVIRGKEWVILTDKIFKENRAVEERQLMNKLEALFETRVIIIPREPGDYTGHTDGILRHYNDDTVLLNSYPPDYKKDFQRRLKIALHNAGLQFIEIPYNPFGNATDNEAHGLYINFLQMENFVLIPTFELKEDDETVRAFEALFPGQVIDTIHAREISKDGGVLNCISWNIHRDAGDLFAPKIRV